MSAQNNATYSVIRYKQDPVRDESINIGIALQTADGINLKLIEDWETLKKSYPFLDIPGVRRTAEFIVSKLGSDRVQYFDYNATVMQEQHASLPAILSIISRQLGAAVNLTEPRYADTAAALQPETLINFLYNTFVDPPKPQRERARATSESAMVRAAHVGLHRRATARILSTVKQAGIKKFQVEPTVTGKTRSWKFDVDVRPIAHLIKHILVLPDLEETYMETASVGRIWQDVKSKHQNLSLLAVYFGEGDLPKSDLKGAERLLRSDNVQPLYAGDLRSYLLDSAGQRTLA